MKIHLYDHFTYKKLLRFTFPAMIMMIFTSLYGVVDGFFVANYAGKSALAGINFVYPILNILATFGYMFGAGGSALVAKTMGEGNAEKAKSLFSLFVYLCTALGIFFAVVGFFLLEPFMAWLGAEGEMLELAVSYGNILLITLPFWNLQFLFQIFFVTAEKPNLGLYVTLIAGFANMLLDAVLVAAFDFGLTGAAVATAISQLLGGCIPVVYFLCRNSSTLRLCRARFDKKAVVKAITNGSSELINGVSGSLVGLLYNTQLLKYAGEDGVAAYSIMMYVSFIFIGIFFGYSNGSSPIVGYHYGAKNYSELKNLRRKGVRLNIWGAIGMFVLAQLAAVPLAKIFAGYDESLYQMTIKGFRIFSASFLFTGVAVFGSSFFTALNNGLVSAILSSLRTIVFQVACVLFFPVLWGVDGIWISVVVAECMAVIMTVLFLVALRKKYNY